VSCTPEEPELEWLLLAVVLPTIEDSRTSEESDTSELEDLPMPKEWLRPSELDALPLLKAYVDVPINSA